MKQKSILFTCITIALIGFCMPLAANAAFDSGSSGADGAFEPTTNTALQIPESGIFNFTTVNIPAGVTVTFKKNAQNTPVTILATGDVTIAGTVSLNGENSINITPGVGGPGGFDGGLGGGIYQPGRRGDGPGGGAGGTANPLSSQPGGSGAGAGFTNTGSNGGHYNSSYPGGAGGGTYGNERILPAIGGSGGGAGGYGSCNSTAAVGLGGGGGGGAIVIASSSIINVTGAISANGATGASSTGCYGGGTGGGGSGGSIRLIANTISGNGTVSAVGGSGGSGSHGSGGAGSLGRIRIECATLTRTAATNPIMSYGIPFAVLPQNMPTLSIVSAGGVEAPAMPKGAFSYPDVTLPYNVTNPITVVVTGTNIPAGQTVTLKASPSSGSPTTATGTLAGTDASSSVSIPITISKAYPSILTASVTFQVASLGIGPIYAQGELVEKIRVEAGMGGGSTMIYITASGKEIPAKQLKS